MPIIKQDPYTSDMHDNIINTAIIFMKRIIKNKSIQIKNNIGNITGRFAYVDRYDTNNNTGTKTQLLTYLDKDVEIVREDGKPMFLLDLSIHKMNQK